MPRPTFAAARAALLAHLQTAGWDVKTFGPSGHLKTPHATSPSGGFRLWFRPQSVHYSRGSRGSGFNANDARSLWVDILDVAPAEIVRIAEAEERR